jgi:hypothetical protein
MLNSHRLWLIFGLGVFLLVGSSQPGLAADRQFLTGHVPPPVPRLKPSGRLPGTNHLELAISLPLRNGAELTEFLRQLYDPASTNFHKYLQPAEFAARFGPTVEDYQAMQDFARSNGLVVAKTYPNRLVLDVAARAQDVERALGVTLRTYRHPAEARNFFAPDAEPSLPSHLRAICIEGLNDYSLPRRAARRMAAAAPARPLSFSGTGPNHEYAGNDFRNAYVPGTALNGSNQVVAMLEYSDYYMVDITNYENMVGAAIGVTNYVPLTNVLVGTGTPTTGANDEVALDIEMAIAMAPKLAQVIVYEKKTVSTTLLNRIATDNLAKQVSSSWMVGNWSASTAMAYDTILTNMAAQGQSFFQASGDSDAYTGSQPLDSGVTVPVDSPYATIVGGTTLTMNNYGVSWASETVWNKNLSGSPNVGSGGGISAYYPIPAWQTNINMTTNGGSATYRNIPDVALTADNIFVCYDNGTTNGTFYFSGTSAAAPLWAGFCALVNQQSTASNPTNYVGFLNPALYAIATNTNYGNCFHDINTGNNIGTNTAGLFYATNGYDLCTGLGTPGGTNLINALAPKPYCLTQPADQTNNAGSTAQFSVLAAGLPPLGYRWLFNGTNLPAATNIFGTTSNVLTLTNVASANAGSYRVVVTNAYGSVTSSVATLTVFVPPAITTQPTNLTVYAGSNATFSATASGTAPLAYQWLFNGTNLPAGPNVSGTTTNVLTLTNAASANAGSYQVIVTNVYGSVTSSVAALTVVYPPTITTQPTNLTVYAGSTAAFSVTASGTAPLGYRWLFNGTNLPAGPNISGTTTNVLTITNVTSANVGSYRLVITNNYGSITSSVATLTVNLLSTTMTLTSSANPGGYKSSLYFTAGVSPTAATGSVQFLTNGVLYDTRTLTAGSATSATFTTLPRGTNAVAARYSGDAYYLPVTNTLSQIVTNHPPAAGPFYTNRYTGLSLKLPVATLSNTWSDADSDIMTLAGIGVSTNGVTVINDAGALVYFNTNSVGDRFTCSVSDGWGGTNLQTIYITVLPLPTNAVPVIGSVGNSNGTFWLSLGGMGGLTYVLQGTTNLVSAADWLPVTTNVLETNGYWPFSVAITNSPYRFFRLKLVP